MSVFGLNTREPLVKGRAAALVVTLELIPMYAKKRSEGTVSSNRSADLIFEALGDASFSIVLVTLINMFKNDSPVLPSALVDAFSAYPKLLSLA